MKQPEKNLLVLSASHPINHLAATTALPFGNESQSQSFSKYFQNQLNIGVPLWPAVTQSGLSSSNGFHPEQQLICQQSLYSGALSTTSTRNWNAPGTGFVPPAPVANLRHHLRADLLNIIVAFQLSHCLSP